MEVLKALDKFLVQLEADGRSIHTRQQYNRHIRLLAHWAATEGHSCAIEAIGHEDVARFLSSPVARTRPDGGVKKATSTNALRTSLKVFLTYCHEAGFIPKNPGRLIRRAICGSPPPRTLSEDEAGRLMDTLAQAEDPEGKRDHCMFHLMLASGIRLGTAVNLDVDDVNLDTGELHLRMMKGDRPEKVYLNKDIQNHLHRFLDDRTSGPLFPGRHGQRLTPRHIQRRFHQWCQEAGITREATVHSLRHTLATRLYERTGDVFLVKEALRHRSVVSTLVYAKMDEKRLRKALEA